MNVAARAFIVRWSLISTPTLIALILSLIPYHHLLWVVSSVGAIWYGVFLSLVLDSHLFLLIFIKLIIWASPVSVLAWLIVLSNLDASTWSTRLLGWSAASHITLPLNYTAVYDQRLIISRSIWIISTSLFNGWRVSFLLKRMAIWILNLLLAILFLLRFNLIEILEFLLLIIFNLNCGGVILLVDVVIAFLHEWKLRDTLSAFYEIVIIWSGSFEIVMLLRQEQHLHRLRAKLALRGV